MVFLTLPGYSFIALSNAVEALRMANRVVSRQHFRWAVASLTGSDVPASNGFSISPTMAIEAVADPGIVFVCGGVDIEEATTQTLIEKLRELAARKISLGSLCTGSYALAKAGLLNRYEAVVHWEQLHFMREHFPLIKFSKQLYAIDRDRYTCTGGTAPMDLMLKIVGRHLGTAVVERISEQYLLQNIRGEQERQQVPLSAYVGVYHANLLEAVSLMHANLEDPLPLDQIADLVGVSRRHVERLFKRHIGQVPTKYYIELRLQRARSLLLHTPMSVLQVSVACGFQSSPHFSKCYRELFGHTPTLERRTQRPQLDMAAAGYATPTN